ncbi:helix-turn-helix domain-containing protein [Oceanobacillus chungangensis]|uniref:HTH cro/C1-type domain-containing protein n=1 Tax=Oceanobacillus chungangensis TaxID=1229152 RepID=A0A3D8PJW3_9BACI|nr:transcriptional regulator [Oceanobacillus chungangensis]RDW15962.1 hypothetical protein CWR45_15825 [Oceanobacillus chungangensis]
MDYELGKFIKQLRTEKGFTLNALSKEIGYSDAYISMVENGKKKKPSLDFLLKLSDILEVDIRKLTNLSNHIDVDLAQIDKLTKLGENKAAVMDKLIQKRKTSMLDESEKDMFLNLQREIYTIREDLKSMLARAKEKEREKNIQEIEKEEREAITYELHSILTRNASVYFKGRLLDRDYKEFLLDLLERSIKEGE